MNNLFIKCIRNKKFENSLSVKKYEFYTFEETFFFCLSIKDIKDNQTMSINCHFDSNYFAEKVNEKYIFKILLKEISDLYFYDKKIFSLIAKDISYCFNTFFLCKKLIKCYGI